MSFPSNIQEIRDRIRQQLEGGKRSQTRNASGEKNAAQSDLAMNKTENRALRPSEQKTVETGAPSLAATRLITLRVNGAKEQLEIMPWTTLLDALREYLDLTGTKKGGDHGQCGACTVSVAAALEMDHDEITAVRLAVGGVAHKPWRDTEAEATLTGKRATVENFHTVAEAIVRGAKGYGSNTFKIALAKRAIVRALTHAAEMEQQA